MLGLGRTVTQQGVAASPTVVRGRTGLLVPSGTLTTTSVGHSPSSTKDQSGVVSSAVTSSSLAPSSTTTESSVGTGAVATGVGVGLTLVVLAVAAVTVVIVLVVCYTVRR